MAKMNIEAFDAARNAEAATQNHFRHLTAAATTAAECGGPRVRRIGVAEWRQGATDTAPTNHERTDAAYQRGYVDGWKRGAFDIYIFGAVAGACVGMALGLLLSKSGAL
jgi:hypothetical protein